MDSVWNAIVRTDENSDQHGAIPADMWKKHLNIEMTVSPLDQPILLTAG